MIRALTLALLLGAATSAAAAPSSVIPAAIYTDPPADKAHPASMEVLHIPSGGVEINAIAYLATGAGPHPTVILFHGLPGNEKNLDLAQAIRRAGWNVVAPNYRGSWGSPGNYRFRQNLADADAVLAFVRDPANTGRLRIDTRRLALVGHSMGGWVAANTASHDTGLIGVVTISAGDAGAMASAPRAGVVATMADNREALAGVTPESMADEVATLGDTAFPKIAPGLKATPYLALTSDDGLAGFTDALVAGVKVAGGTKVSTAHVATDHSWSDRRIDLEARIITWLQGLK
ncbi:alpha/beta hydrolase family protein [Phenylobacterium sp.]|jgi:pimeloyl-ACP methyl ester carboxylesterase|uniref:alpha/beta hydrolase family protein n=1 Tax=Phenylobacterium sp. TaxID=1871053 RepID=UPI0035AEB0B7